ncbi:MAG: hypothetical protein IJX44_01510 [Bacteroidaceae bacterium]|nr:hypothetical protein [Bacteroidaceae bacterium]
MRHIAVWAFAALLLFSGCTSQGMRGSDAGMMLGAQVGGMLGGLLGDPDGRNYTGHMLGSIIGTVTGAAIGSILTATPDEAGGDDGYDDDFAGTPRSEVEMVRRKSSRLSIRQIRFIDQGRDHTIDAGEDCRIVFLVMNRGDRPVRGVTPIVEEVSGMKHLHVSPTVSVERILPGEGIKYTATIRGGKRLKSGEAIFRVYALEGDGSSTSVKEFALPTRRRMR